MEQAPIHVTSLLTQSRYFVPSFNTAIIDGPLKIYFSDEQENDALKIYFQIQDLLLEDAFSLQSLIEEGRSIFLMLYPDAQSFKDIFEAPYSTVEAGRLGNDFVVGVSGGDTDETCKLIHNRLRGMVESIS